MLDYRQVFRLSTTVNNCLGNICSSRETGIDGKKIMIAKHEPEEIAVIGKMLCEALNGMQDEVRFHTMRLPTKAESAATIKMVDKIVFEDTAPEDEFIGYEERVCPRCKFDQIKPEHNHCMICGLKLKEFPGKCFT